MYLIDCQFLMNEMVNIQTFVIKVWTDEMVTHFNMVSEQIEVWD